MITSEFNMDLALEVRGEEKALEKALKIARSMIDDGMDIDTVIKHTGLTVDDILRLK